MTWTLPLPWTTPPLTGNDRDHWRKKAAKVEDAVNEARWAHEPDLFGLLGDEA